MKNLGFVALLALVLGVASAFTTSSKTAKLAACTSTTIDPITNRIDLSTECPGANNVFCCTATQSSVKYVSGQPQLFDGQEDVFKEQ